MNEMEQVLAMYNGLVDDLNPDERQQFDTLLKGLHMVGDKATDNQILMVAVSYYATELKVEKWKDATKGKPQWQSQQS